MSAFDTSQPGRPTGSSSPADLSAPGVAATRARDEVPAWVQRGAARIETDVDGVVVAWNRAAEQLYGYSSREAIGRPIVTLVVPARAMRQAAEIMQALALGSSWEGEFDVRCRDGRLMRVLVHDAPLYDASGSAAGVVGHSIPVGSPRRAPVRAGAPVVGWRRALRGAMFDPSVGVSARLRGYLIVSGIALESAWAVLSRWAGPEQSIGVAGAVAVICLLAIAVADVRAGLVVALVAGVVFDLVVGMEGHPGPLAYGGLLVLLWVLSALAAGVAAVRLRAQAQRGMAEAVALHRELVGSLVPSPRLRRIDVSVASLYLPGEQRLELGGDFYAAVERADEGIALMVGDVSGHGPEAAALAAMLRAGWEALVEAGVSPQLRLQSLNNLVLAHAPSDELFATVCSVVIDHDLTAATITLAGHPSPILIAPGGAIPFEAQIGVPLGVSDSMAWTPFRVQLPAQFSLLLYTDGLIEGRAAPSSSDRFGKERLLDALTNSPDTGHALLEQVVVRAKNAHGGPLPDDAALLLVERRPLT